MPLSRGRYSATNPLYSYLGQPVNASQSDIAVRTNATVLGMQALTDGAALTTQVATAVAIPVEVGDIITKVSVFTGATAANTPTNSWAAVYSGVAVPALLNQSVDGLTAAIPASGRFDFTIPATMVTVANAPQGFWYASVMVKATVATPTLAAVTIAAAVAYQWYTTAPLKMGALTHGAALVGAAPATIVVVAGQAVTPIVVLS